MTRRLVYLVGEPGAGKSTLLAAALDGWAREPQKKPLAHDLLHRDGIVHALELGVRRPTFPGTDALAMNAIVAAEQLLWRPPAPLVIGEGARLGCRRFFEFAVRAGYRVHVVLVQSPNAAQQRIARDGGEQKDSWVRAQATKARNVFEVAGTLGADATTIDTSTSAAVDDLRSILSLPAPRRTRKAA
ncbi:P-loop-containing protein [Rhodococcus sp. NPDC003994]